MNLKQCLSRCEAGFVYDVLLAAALVYLDPFIEVQNALATFYVITPLLSAETLTEKVTLRPVDGCIGLSALSYVAGRGLQGELVAARLAVAIADMVITCLLINRNHLARLTLIKFNAFLQSSEERINDFRAEPRCPRGT